ncbi:MAG: hypothetical protein ACRETL_11400, partial [Gammaproteobacteria bacterium]
LYAFPQYTQVSITNVPIGSSHYHSLQMSLDRRFAHGVAVHAAYTISKNLERVTVLNPQDINLANLRDTPLEQRLSPFDTPQKFSLVVSLALPYGHGQRWGGSSNRLMSGLFGGWNINTEYNTEVGFPWAFPNAAPLVAQSAKLSDSQRDEQAKSYGETQFDPSLGKWFNTAIFPTSAQAPFTLRTFPTIFPDVRGKPLNVVDASVFKAIPVHERMNFEIRADFHNALNHPWFSVPLSTDVTDSGFAQMAAQSIDDNSEPRLIVLSLKLVF